MTSQGYQDFCKEQNAIAIAAVGDVRADVYGRTISQLEGDERYARIGDNSFEPMPGDYAASKIQSAKDFALLERMQDIRGNDDF